MIHGNLCERMTMSTAEKINNQTAAASAEPERLDLRSQNIVADKQAELLQL